MDLNLRALGSSSSPIPSQIQLQGPSGVPTPIQAPLHPLSASTVSIKLVESGMRSSPSPFFHPGQELPRSLCFREKLDQQLWLDLGARDYSSHQFRSLSRWECSFTPTYSIFPRSPKRICAELGDPGRSSVGHFKEWESSTGLLLLLLFL